MTNGALTYNKGQIYYEVTGSGEPIVFVLRYVSAQFIPYLTDDLWRKQAKHANTLAIQLADGLSKIDGIKLTQVLQTNQVFVSMPRELIDKLHQAGHRFYDWDTSKNEVRFVTSWDNTSEDVERLVSDAQSKKEEHL